MIEVDSSVLTTMEESRYARDHSLSPRRRVLRDFETVVGARVLILPSILTHALYWLAHVRVPFQAEEERHFPV